VCVMRESVTLLQSPPLAAASSARLAWRASNTRRALPTRRASCLLIYIYIGILLLAGTGLGSSPCGRPLYRYYARAARVGHARVNVRVCTFQLWICRTQLFPMCLIVQCNSCMEARVRDRYRQSCSAREFLFWKYELLVT